MFTPEAHEAGIAAFVRANKRARVEGFIASKKGRKKFLNGLAHWSDWDPACIVEIAPQFAFVP